MWQHMSRHAKFGDNVTDGNHMDKALSDLGKEGWEPYAVYQHPSRPNEYDFFLKRWVAEDEVDTNV